jgi:hypothetical protein
MKLLALACVLVIFGCKGPSAIDYVNHHFITRIKADTLVDHRNAWTLKQDCIPGVANSAIKIGDDIPLVQNGQDSCPWKNPTALVHP